MSKKIKAIRAREILDSRGVPTIETEVFLETGHVGVAAVSSGISIGKYEAVELRDGDPDRFQGKGVLKAVNNVNQHIARALIGMDASYQSDIDRVLIEVDGTKNKSRLGANAILSASQAVLEAAAKAYNLATHAYIRVKYQLNENYKIPSPIFNLINGGRQGAGNLDFQEFHVIPSSRKSYPEALQCGAEIYHSLKEVLIHKGAIHSIGDDGGFAPNLFTNMDALEIITEAISQTKYKLAQDVFLGLDVAAHSFFKDGKYFIKDRSQALTSEEFIEYYVQLNKEYHLFILEDPLIADDWKNWSELTATLSKNTTIVGDYLLSTNKDRVQTAIDKRACNAILVKPNQIGTITETIEVIRICREAGWKIIVSHRSGETEDDFIADFAVGVGADYTKFGAPVRGERIIKYNRLLKIQDEIKA